MRNLQKFKYFSNFSIYCIIILVLLTDYIVYATGGTEFAFTHIMYVPIIITAYLFGIKGGISIGFFAGIALGPVMPLNVAEDAIQAPESWMLRMVFFIVIGSLIGSLFQQIKQDRDLTIEKSYEHYLTGYPNHNKLRLDLSDMIMAESNCTLVVFKIVNLGYINRYVDYQVEEKTIYHVISTILQHFNKDFLYCITRNEYVLVFPGKSIQDIHVKAEKLLQAFDEPVLIDGIPIDLIVRSGIANYPLHGSETYDLLKKLERTLDQDKYDENKISVYQNSIAEKNKENYELIIALYDAIKNNEFSIVYQPIINLKNNIVMGLEALLRWTHPTQGKINPERFIQLAEYMGIINEITKWVIKNTIDQLDRWKAQGLATKVAINISSKDLIDDSIIQYTKNYMELTNVQPEQLEFELTERTIVDNENKAVHLLNEISDLGLKISLDDFGTGYNSLIHLVKLPIDYVKLDKFFISNMDDISNRPLVEGVINTVHTLGKEIIAEGVETKEQLEILKNMCCDNIQGYYYSKPLPPEEVKEFIQKFNA